MAEETLRYRVEFDQAQVEGKLAGLRNALGNSISAAQYGGQIAAGGYSQLRSDLQNTFGNAFAGPSQQFARGLQTGILEAGVAATSVAVPATMLSMGLLGVQPTLTGIAAGVSTIASGTTAAGATIASAIPGAASLALQGARMLGAGVVSPVGLKLAAAYYAGKTVMSAGETMIEDFRATDDIRDILTASGMRQSSAHSLTPDLISAGRGIGMGGAELTGVLEAGIGSGLISPGGMSDPKAVGNKLISTAKQARNIQQVLQTSMSEAMNIMGGMGAAGIQVGDMTSMVMNAGALGSVTGMGQGAMMRAGAMGAQTANRIGLEASAGAGIAMSAVASAQSGLMALTPGLRGSVGGVNGMAGLMTQGNMNMINSRLGGAVGAATFMDPSAMANFTQGGMSIGQAISAGASNMLSGGPQNIAKNLFAMDDAKSNLSEHEIRGQNIAMIMKGGSMLGISPSDKSNMALVAGSVLGLDTSTTAGRAQARAFYEGTFDPGVSTRRIGELQGRARGLAEQGTTFGATASRNLGFMTPTSVGRGIGEEIRERMSYTGTRIGQGIDRFTERFGKGFREAGRVMGVPGVRSREQELYTVNMPSSFRDSSVNEVLSRDLEVVHGVSMKEHVKGVLTRAKLFKTSKQEEDEAKANVVFAGADKAMASEGPAVSRLWKIIGGDKGLTEKLRGQSREEQLKTMADVATGAGMEGVSDSAYALALVKRNIAAEAGSDRREIGTMAAAAQDRATTALTDITTRFDPGGLTSPLTFFTSLGKSMRGGKQAAGRDVASMLISSGADDKQRIDFSTRALAFLQASDEQELDIAEGISGTFKGKGLVARLEKLKSSGYKDQAAEMLRTVAAPARESALLSTAAQTSTSALNGNIDRAMERLDTTAEFGGMQEGIGETFAGSSRAADRELMDSIGALKQSIQAEREILQTLLNRTRSDKSLDTRSQ